jgi:hypothetical protein
LEATTLQNYYRLKVRDALTTATEWALEEPYSKRPFIFGSFLADQLKEFSIAERLARDGLKANPDDFTLRNNLCFTLLKADKIPQAEQELGCLGEPENGREKIVFFATSGLLQFKKGNVVIGRELYNKAIRSAVDAKDMQLAARATINFAIAEIEADMPFGNAMRDQALSMVAKMNSPEIILAREDLKDALPRIFSSAHK